MGPGRYLRPRRRPPPGPRSRRSASLAPTGSMTLVAALMASGLVDEYRLFLYPFVAGEGRRLFGDAGHLGALRLVEAESYRSGVVRLRYRPDAAA